MERAYQEFTDKNGTLALDIIMSSPEETPPVSETDTISETDAGHLHQHLEELGMPEQEQSKSELTL